MRIVEESAWACADCKYETVPAARWLPTIPIFSAVENRSGIRLLASIFDHTSKFLTHSLRHIPQKMPLRMPNEYAFLHPRQSHISNLVPGPDRPIRFFTVPRLCFVIGCSALVPRHWFSRLNLSE